MQTFKKLFLLLPIFCLPLTACRVSRQVVKDKETVKKEVSERIVKYRDTLLFTPKVQTSLKLPISDLKKCPESGFKDVLKDSETSRIYTQKNGNAKATVSIKHDTITVTAECDSITLKAKIMSEFQNQYSESAERNSELIEKNTRANWWMIAGLICIALIAGIVIGKLT
ncbi:MAG: hypothetical protein JNN23_04820 [Chryseobacterium gambrini]|nr:hypothetical protein [Chryseobacterium gambrini]